MSPRRPARLLAALLLLLAAAPAAAFQRSGGSGGVCLWWGTRALTWAIHLDRAGAPPACDATATLAAATAGFAAWTPAGDAACTDLSTSGAATASTAVGYDARGPNTNLVIFRQGACSLVPAGDPCHAAGTCNCWDDATAADRNILALTTVSYSTRDGAILDADIEVNDWDGTAGAFANTPQHGWYLTCGATGSGCTSYGQPAGCRYIDLPSVLTHEAGHVFGLAHVSAPGATMNPSLAPGDTSPRTLAADDVAGICAVYPAGAVSPVCAVNAGTSGGGGCGCQGGAGGLASLLLVAGALLARGRRRRAPPR